MNRPLSHSSNSPLQPENDKQRNLSYYNQNQYPSQSTKNTLRENTHNFSSFESSAHLPMCKFHPNFPLQNFCDCQQCLLPMCPTCVTIHTEQHQQQNTYGHYLSYESVRQQVRHTFQSSVKTFEEISKDYSNDFADKIRIKDKMKTRFDDFRSRVYKEVTRIMDDLENRLSISLQRFLQNQEEKYKMLQQKVQFQYQKLKKDIKTLASDRGVKTIIQFYDFRRKELFSAKEQIKDEMEQLRKEGVIIQMENGIPNSLRQIFNTIVLKQRNVERNGEPLIKWQRIGKVVENQFQFGSSESGSRKGSDRVEAQ